MEYRKVIKLGGSLVIPVPTWYLYNAGIVRGDTVKVEQEKETIIITKLRFNEI